MVDIHVRWWIFIRREKDTYIIQGIHGVVTTYLFADVQSRGRNPPPTPAATTTPLPPPGATTAFTGIPTSPAAAYAAAHAAAREGANPATKVIGTASRTPAPAPAPWVLWRQPLQQIW